LVPGSELPRYFQLCPPGDEYPFELPNGITLQSALRKTHTPETHWGV